jgi:uncharacterized protein YbjT (DUF2867 family)
VETVLSVGRNPTGQRHERLREIVHADLFDLSAIEAELSGFDAGFFCLGVSSAGMTEESYRSVTYDLTMSVARCLAKLNPRMTFIYVSGMGTDSTGHGRTMWARVKGETENALLRLPFKAAYMFRPALIVPLDGVKSKTRLYRVFYAVLGPILPWLYAAAPKYVTTTAQVGRAMLAVAKGGAPVPVLENSDINKV